jgi:hypothetical protein
MQAAPAHTAVEGALVSQQPFAKLLTILPGFESHHKAGQQLQIQYSRVTGQVPGISA